MTEQDEMVSLSFDFGPARRGEITESYLTALGAVTGSALRQMLSGAKGTMNIKGKPSEIDAYVGALFAEKAYMQAISQSGLGNPKTRRNAAELSKAVRKFERRTGLKWPFK